MANINRVILAGNLTRDPQLSYTPSNTAVCKFGLAVNHRWTDRNSNEKREETCFVDLTAFGKTGETINRYMTKGRSIFIEGRLQFSQWTGQDGQKRSKLEVVVDNFQFLDSQRSAAGGAGAGGTAMGERDPAPSYAGEPQPVSAPMDDGPPAAAYGDADIPF